MTDQVALRPVSEADLVVLENLTQDPEAAGEFALFGFFDPGRHRRKWAENGLLGDDGGTLMVVRGSESLGFVNWRRRQTTPAAHCWTMGIALLPQARGQGYGAEAHRLLARYLFAHSPVHRIEADTEVENIAEQKTLERAGFSREGVMRGIGWRDGAWRDGVTYSLLRTDPPV
ncbi:GNAT family N-acetyltransferase [Streptomyces sp. NBC_01775]|uniref:GNAT family N-acetyltransferase n=1 Tax=Streptomyces sp. NBC_01775 TaxID=2975939 RepID=UPI002DD94DBB|nr:GNAT family protein [Streptomyces sp. NBC_01775]WSB77155.1 GNAT family N-acetyltransferase [Streptomyces sp. NBC_01775]